MELAEYFKTFHKKAYDEFVRFTTPNYYEPNIHYQLIDSIRGLTYEIVSGTYMRDGDIHMTLRNVKNHTHKISIHKSEAHLALKKVDESQLGVGLSIPNDKSNIYMIIDGVEYSIWQAYWRNYNDKTLGGRVIIRRTSDKPVKTNYGEKQPYFELYSHFGSKWHLKHVYSYDNVNREQYDVKFNISVREFKEKVFGNPNVKLKCDLFSHL